MINRNMFFVANWKMFGRPSYYKILEKINRYIVRHKKNKSLNIVACVPNTLITLYSNKLKKTLIKVGAQNCSEFQNDGPYTGSVSGKMIKDAGAKYVIIGHSESREQGDTDKIIKNKIESAFKAGLQIIFCFGETLSEKNKKKTKQIIRNQIQKAITNKKFLKKILFAYEPVWSIGSNKIPKITELNYIIRDIKKFVKYTYKNNKKIKVLYGGSVNSLNIEKLKLINQIDGYLVGGASQSSKKFIDILKNYYK
tara:strand:- start:1461 stop:2219 length:759 start_codon:yes stop_codon:yes gene_type:complete